MTMTLVIAAGLAVSVIIIFVGLGQVVGGGSDEIANRLDRFASRQDRDVGPQPGAEEHKGRLTEFADQQLKKNKRGADLAQELARADLKLTPGEYVLMQIVAVIIGGLLAWFIFGQLRLDHWFVVLPGGFIGYFIPRIIVGFRQGQRQGAFADQLPDSVSLLANSMRSGYSLPQSMDLLSRESSPPISVEFGRVVREMSLGIGLEPALYNMTRRIRNEDLDLLVTAVLVQQEVGGNLATILEIIGFTIRERIRIKGEIQVLTAQQTSAGALVGSMPAILTVILFLINPTYMNELFNSIVGNIIFCIAAGLLIAAGFLIRKIVDIKV
jgi:tight adherence protein B